MDENDFIRKRNRDTDSDDNSYFSNNTGHEAIYGENGLDTISNHENEEPEEALSMEKETYVFYPRNHFANFIWTLRLPKKNFNESFSLSDSCEIRSGHKIYYKLTNRYYDGSNSASLVYSFVIGEQFKGKLDENDIDLFLNEADNISNKGLSLASNDDSHQHNNGNGSQNRQAYGTVNDLRSDLVGILKEKENDEDSFSNGITALVVDFKSEDFSKKFLKIGEVCNFEIQLNSEFFNREAKFQRITIENNIYKNFNKKEIVYTGLVNEAMTCYMNSFLQTMNILGVFKRAIFKMPIENNIMENNNGASSISYSLQRLFYDLMTEKQPISTNKLIRSFGWGREELLMQHDVQEFNLIISDVLEKKMKGTSDENIFKYLFNGKTLNYIKCINVDYTSKREEEFSDIQLNVKGCKDIYESFEKYTEEEILEGDNKYEAEGFGKQDAKKGVKFSSFPNVLILQLKRFEHNPRKDIMEKINDRFEFQPEINLNKYLANPKDDEKEQYETEYVLHSVVVHRGTMNNGHYYAFIRPTLEDNWYCFDDEIVREADKSEVFEGNFGGPNRVYRINDRGEPVEFLQRSEGNAYILVYIKAKMRSTILQPIVQNDIPGDLVKIFEKEKEWENKKVLMRIRQKQYMNIYVMTKDTLKNHLYNGFCASNCETDLRTTLFDSNYQKFTINIPKNLKVIEFIDFISQQTNISKHLIKLFRFELLEQFNPIKRFNHRLTFVNPDDYEKSFQDLTETRVKRSPYFYIGIDNHFDDLKIFERNTNLAEEDEEAEERNQNDQHADEDQMILFNSRVSESNESIKIYLKRSNIWKFFENEYNLYRLETCDTLQFTESYNNFINDKYICISFKYLNKNNDSFLVKQEDIKTVRISETLTLDKVINAEEVKNIYEMHFPELKDQIKSADVVYFEEITNILSNEENENGPYFMKEFDLTKPLSDFYGTDNLIIFPSLNFKEHIQIPGKNLSVNSLHPLILNVLSNYYKTISVTLANYIPNFPMKVKICLTDNEEQLKTRVFEELCKSGYLMSYFRRTNDQYIILTKEKKLLKIEEFVENYTKDLITLIPNQDRENKYGNTGVFNFFPAFRYISQKSELYAINYNLSLFKNDEPASPEDSSDENIWDVFKLSLMDAFNNTVAFLYYVYNTNQLSSCEDFLNYMNESVLATIYPDIPLDNMFFVLLHPERHYCFDLFVDKTTRLFLHNNSNPDINYQLKPYIGENYSLIHSPENMKIFVSFLTRDCVNVCDAIVTFIEKSWTLGEVKAKLVKEMEGMHALKGYELNFQKLKLYKSRICYRMPSKDIMLHAGKDKELFTEIYGQDVPNLIVEFPALNNDFNSNSLIIK